MFSPSVLTGLGILISVCLILFVVVKAHYQTIQPAMAAVVLIAALVVALAFSKIGTDIRLKVTKSGAELETLTKQATQAAESASVDRQQVEAVEKRVTEAADQISVVAANVRELEQRS